VPRRFPSPSPGAAAMKERLATTHCTPRLRCQAVGLLAAAMGSTVMCGVARPRQVSFVATGVSLPHTRTSSSPWRSGTHLLAPRPAPLARVACLPECACLAAVLALGCRGVSRAKARGSAPRTARSAADAGAGQEPAAQDEMLAEARAAAEAAKMELEAAKLRAEAAELERANAAERRTSRAGQLLSGSRGPDGDYGLAVKELPARLKEVLGLEATEVEAERLATACGLRDGQALGFEELASERFDEELGALLAEARRARVLAQEQEAAARAAAERPSPPPSTPGRSDDRDDRSTGTRILATLTYLLPLIDGVQFALPIVQLVPALAPFFALLVVPSAIVNAVPFGSVILFVAFVVLSTNEDLPRLLRFNLQQAVLVDMGFVFTSILVAGLNGGAMPSELAGICFLGLVVVVAYCATSNAAGEYPDGIPLISDATKRLLDSPSSSDGPGGFSR